RLPEAVGDRRLAALLSKDYVTGPARERRVRAEHGKRLLHHQVDANAGFAREVVRAENGLVHRDRAVAETTDERSKLRQPVEAVGRLVPVEDVKSDDELLESGIACTFAEPVGAAVHHFGT